MKMKDFAAIDFETANRCQSSVCSVGVVVVRDGKIADKYYSLIRPKPNTYSHFNTRIHGITYEDTAQARTFPEVWAEVQPLVNGLTLVAHNSPFDEGCLKDPDVDMIVNFHSGRLFPSIKNGQVGWRKGAVMASVDTFNVTVHGKGGHGAYPAAAGTFPLQRINN